MTELAMMLEVLQRLEVSELERVRQAVDALLERARELHEEEERRAKERQREAGIANLPTVSSGNLPELSERITVLIERHDGVVTPDPVVTVVTTDEETVDVRAFESVECSVTCLDGLEG